MVYCGKRSSKMLKNSNWKDYEILDVENGFKFERFGNIILKRPETLANNTEQSKVKFNSSFENKKWTNKLEPWFIEYKDLKFKLETGKFKHVGIFPEQSDNWDWIRQQLKQSQDAKVLNLFAYTGAASIAAAKENPEEIVHLDALKSSLDTAKENAILNNVENQKIRYIKDDAIKFLNREIRRERQYTGIIMDPPSFGRGPKGEMWKIKEQLPELIDLAVQLLMEKGEFLVINTYSTDLQKEEVEELLIRTLKKYDLPLNTKSYNLSLPINSGGNLEAGQTVRWNITGNNL